jgi:hypothetical protein
MKKLLVAVLALSTVSAFAQKSLITFGTFGDAGNSSTFDVSNSLTDTGVAGTDETSVTNVMVNYTYAISDSFMAGVKVGNYATATSADNFTTTGVQFYYNLDGSVNDTCYVGLHYTMKNWANDDVTTTTAVEYGHRFAIGSWKKFNLAFSPSIAYSMMTKDFDAAGSDDATMSALAWNWIKFDVLF